MGNSANKSHKARTAPTEAPKASRKAKSGADQAEPQSPNAPPFVPAEMSAGQSLVAALKAPVGEALDKSAPAPQPVAAIKVLSQEDPNARPNWYRPADSKARKQFEKIAVMRGAGHSDADIAKRLKTTEQMVRQVVYLAKKNGWADSDGEPVDLEAELALDVDRKIVRNISSTLDGHMTNWQTHEMTLAAAKGRGIFKNHEKTEGGSVQLPVVAIRIEMPALGEAQQVINEANVGGVPAYLEGELADGPPTESNALLVPAAPDAVDAGHVPAMRSE